MGCCESRQKNPFLEEELKKGIKGLDNNKQTGSLHTHHMKKMSAYKSMSANKSYSSHINKQHLNKFFSNNVNQKEVTELNNAFANEDLETIISYLNNDTKLKNILNMPHDWAPPLLSVGTLATELLAELFEDDDEHEEQQPKVISQKKRELKNKLMQTEVQLNITNNLQSLQQDRREWSLILILILIDNDDIMQEYFIKQNLMSYVIPFLQPHHHQELKILAFDVLKEIYAGRVPLAVQFLNSSGAQYFKNFFTNNHLEMIFVGVYGLILLTEDDKSTAHNKEIASILTNLGFQEILANIQSEMNFIEPNEDKETQDKRKYCVTAVKRVLQFMADNTDAK